MRRHGFSLVEILVTIVIVATLLAIIFPILGKSRETARSIKCASHLHECAVAAYAYTNDYKMLPGANRSFFDDLELPEEVRVCPANRDPNLPSYFYPASIIVFNSPFTDYRVAYTRAARAYQDSPKLELIQDTLGFHLGKCNVALFDGSVITKSPNMGLASVERE